MPFHFICYIDCALIFVFRFSFVLVFVRYCSLIFGSILLFVFALCAKCYSFIFLYLFMIHFVVP